MADKNSSRHTFSPNVTEEMLMNPESYNSVFHQQTANCYSTADFDILRRISKHDTKCHQKVDQQQKESFKNFFLISSVIIFDMKKYFVNNLTCYILGEIH